MTDTAMTDDRAITMMSALAQPTRFGAFRLLMASGDAGLSAGTIADELGVPQNTLSAHLNILSNAGIVQARREGRSIIYSVNVDATRGLLSHLIDDCCSGHPELCSFPKAI